MVNKPEFEAFLKCTGVHKDQWPGIFSSVQKAESSDDSGGASDEPMSGQWWLQSYNVHTVRRAKSERQIAEGDGDYVCKQIARQISQHVDDVAKIANEHYFIPHLAVKPVMKSVLSCQNNDYTKACTWKVLCDLFPTINGANDDDLCNITYNNGQWVLTPAEPESKVASSSTTTTSTTPEDDVDRIVNFIVSNYDNVVNTCFGKRTRTNDEVQATTTFFTQFDVSADFATTKEILTALLPFYKEHKKSTFEDIKYDKTSKTWSAAKKRKASPPTGTRHKRSKEPEVWKGDHFSGLLELVQKKRALEEEVKALEDRKTALQKHV